MYIDVTVRLHAQNLVDAERVGQDWLVEHLVGMGAIDFVKRVDAVAAESDKAKMHRQYSDHNYAQSTDGDYLVHARCHVKPGDDLFPADDDCYHD